VRSDALGFARVDRSEERGSLAVYCEKDGAMRCCAGKGMKEKDMLTIDYCP